MGLLLYYCDNYLFILRVFRGNNRRCSFSIIYPRLIRVSKREYRKYMNYAYPASQQGAFLETSPPNHTKVCPACGFQAKFEQNICPECGKELKHLV